MHIGFGEKTLSDENIDPLFSGMQMDKLKTFNVHGNSKLTLSGWTKLNAVLKQTDSLTDLDVGDCQLDDEKLRTLIDGVNFCHLEGLNLNGSTKLTIEGWKMVNWILKQGGEEVVEDRE